MTIEEEIEALRADRDRWVERNRILEARLAQIRDVAAGKFDDATIAELRKARGLDPL